MAGHWRQHETWDGTYDLDDLLDIIEAMNVKAENERRQQEHDRMMADLNRQNKAGVGARR